MACPGIVGAAVDRPSGERVERVWSTPIKVLVVDDSAFMRGVLVRKVESDPRFKVIDTAANGREAIDKMLALKPDVMTLDVDMPVMNGIEALKEIVRLEPRCRAHGQRANGSRTQRSPSKRCSLGAVDFIPKSRGTENIHEKLMAAAEARQNRARLPQGAVDYRSSVATPDADHRRREDYGKDLHHRIQHGWSAGVARPFSHSCPGNMPVPVVIAQHMPPQFTKALAQRLNEAMQAEGGRGQRRRYPDEGRCLHLAWRHADTSNGRRHQSFSRSGREPL